MLYYTKGGTYESFIFFMELLNSCEIYFPKLFQVTGLP